VNSNLLFENDLYTILFDLFMIDSCVILYLQYEVNMLRIKIELEIYIEIY
jgi:hypothetical protein